MTKYTSHKTVEAWEIQNIFRNPYRRDYTVVLKDADNMTLDETVFARDKPVAGDFVIRYADGYISWSPRAAFLEGYTASDKAPITPVKGYRQQNDATLILVNENKVTEEKLLRLMDSLKTGDVDQRWLALARTHIEQGFMALNRSIFKPERVTLD